MAKVGEEVKARVSILGKKRCLAATPLPLLKLILKPKNWREELMEKKCISSRKGNDIGMVELASWSWKRFWKWSTILKVA